MLCHWPLLIHCELEMKPQCTVLICDATLLATFDPLCGMIANLQSKQLRCCTSVLPFFGQCIKTGQCWSCTCVKMCYECCSTLCFINKIFSGHVMLNISAWLRVNLLNNLTTVVIFPFVLQTVVKRVAHTYKMPTALASMVRNAPVLCCIAQNLVLVDRSWHGVFDSNRINCTPDTSQKIRRAKWSTGRL